MSDELDRVSPRESARNKARDRKIRGPKVVSVNPGLKKLAQHLEEKRTQKKKTTTPTAKAKAKSKPGR